MNLINKTIINIVKIMPKQIVFIFAKKYISGEKLEDAVRVTKDLNDKGIIATLDVLGEFVSNETEAKGFKNDFLKVLDTIHSEKLNANVSIKPTQMGLLLDKNLAYENLREIIARAKGYNNSVRIDMEDSSITDDILELFEKLRDEFDNVGIVLQAYMRRTLADIDKISRIKSNYRLCKGIYVEPESIAFKGKDEVRNNYLKALNKMLDNDDYVGIATHDKYLIDEAYKIIEERNLAKDKYEFQMLYGVTEHLRNKINSDGHKIKVYVPFGESWYPYSIRRLQENPNMMWYTIKSIFSLKK